MNEPVIVRVDMGATEIICSTCGTTFPFGHGHRCLTAADVLKLVTPFLLPKCGCRGTRLERVNEVDQWWVDHEKVCSRCKAIHEVLARLAAIE